MRQQLAQLGGGAHALAIQILGNPDDAADAVHDAFATALAKPGSYDARRGPLRPWFLSVVRNRCIDMLRRRRSSDLPVEQLVELSLGPAETIELDELGIDTASTFTTTMTEAPPERAKGVMVKDVAGLVAAIRDRGLLT